MTRNRAVFKLLYPKLGLTLLFILIDVLIMAEFVGQPLAAAVAGGLSLGVLFLASLAFKTYRVHSSFEECNKVIDKAERPERVSLKGKILLLTSIEVRVDWIAFRVIGEYFYFRLFWSFAIVSLSDSEVLVFERRFMSASLEPMATAIKEGGGWPTASAVQSRG